VGKTLSGAAVAWRTADGKQEKKSTKKEEVKESEERSPQELAALS
jgi:hypothetical protein